MRETALGVGGRRRRVRKWAAVFERAERNYSAYVPDLPGCIATGATVEGADGDEIPEPTTFVDFVEHNVPAAARRS